MDELSDEEDGVDTCPECGCDLECEFHNWDCSYGDEEENEDD